MSTFRTVRMDASLDECYCSRLRYARVCGRRRKRPIILCGRSALGHPHLGADKERTTGPREHGSDPHDGGDAPPPGNPVGHRHGPEHHDGADGSGREPREAGRVPPALAKVFEPVMQGGGGHILFFVNWVKYRRSQLPWWRRPAFRLRCAGIIQN